MFASYRMWHAGRATADQCEGRTLNSGHVLELGYLHSRGVTFAVFGQGPFERDAAIYAATRQPGELDNLAAWSATQPMDID